MAKMNKKALLKIAKILEKLPRKKFDMSHWALADAKGHHCTTTCCAFGWGVAKGVFPGYTYKITKSDIDPDDYSIAMVDKHEFYCSEWDKSTELCGITDEERDFIFVADPDDVSSAYKTDNPTPKAVARVIRRFVKEGAVWDSGKWR